MVKRTMSLSYQKITQAGIIEMGRYYCKLDRTPVLGNGAERKPLLTQVVYLWSCRNRKWANADTHQTNPNSNP